MTPGLWFGGLSFGYAMSLRLVAGKHEGFPNEPEQRQGPKAFGLRQRS